jgi:DNA-binding transcriptional LysR family regulator
MDRITSMTAFATVVASGSFAAAAQRLNMSPAMVTNHVRALEEHLGARLLNRTTRKLSLTDAGKAYLDQATMILAQLEAADSSVSDLQATPRGTLHVNTANVLSDALVPMFDAFGCAYPEITLELVTTDRMPDLIEDGIDVAIRFNPSPESSFIVRHLGSFRVVMCASFAYLATRGEPREPADLSGHNCLSYMYPGFTVLTREWHLKGPKGEVTVPVSGNLHTNNIDLLRAAALTGRGIVRAPIYRIRDDLRAGRLVQVLPDWHSGDLPIVALYPNREHLPAKVRLFIDFAVKHFAEELKRAPETQIAAAG